MTWRLHEEAKDDLQHPPTDYRAHASPAVPARLQAQCERVADLLTRVPGQGQPAGRGRRRFALSVFPYLVVYRPQGEGILILVVRHQRRHPAVGESR